MSRYGLLIDYDFCIGCHSCEMACKQEHQLPPGKWGIKIAQSGPMKLDGDRWSYDYVPIPNQLCDLCSNRVKLGNQPACVKHCQAGVMKYGTIDELAEFMKIKPRTVLFVPC